MKKVIVTNRRGAIIDVAPVIRETKTMVFAGHEGKEQHELKKPYSHARIGGRTMKQYRDYEYPSDEDIANAELIVERQRMTARREAKRRERAEAKKRADPRYLLLQRFRNAEWEPWDKLTLEQLQQIAAILDSVKGPDEHADQDAD